MRQLGPSRRYLTPIAWAAGSIVLLVRGIRLLCLNWRLTLIELVPAAWIWFVMWDLKQHALRGDAFREITPTGVLVTVVIAVGASTASFWCNTVFAYAVCSPPPRIAAAGLICLGVPGLHPIGLALLSIGTGLYADGMSSVQAMKLSMKLDVPPPPRYRRGLLPRRI